MSRLSYILDKLKIEKKVKEKETEKNSSEGKLSSDENRSSVYGPDAATRQFMQQEFDRLQMQQQEERFRQQGLPVHPESRVMDALSTSMIMDNPGEATIPALEDLMDRNRALQEELADIRMQLNMETERAHKAYRYVWLYIGVIITIQVVLGLLRIWVVK